jgi:hypothetical protein
MSAVISKKKPPVHVETAGDLACADFTGLARLLLRLNQQTDLKVVKNEQSSRPVPPEQ